MSLWSRVVSRLSDSGTAFIESTRRDIADFAEAIKVETKDLLPSGSAAQEHQLHQHDNEAGGSSIGRLMSDRGLDLLPAVLAADHGHPESRQHDSGGSHHQQQLPTPSPPPHALLNDRRTYDADPVDAQSRAPPPGYSALAAHFVALYNSTSSSAEAPMSSTPDSFLYGTEAVSASLAEPTVRRFYHELVEAGGVPAALFWARYFYARQRVVEDERKREKLQSRLDGIRASDEASDSELPWDDDEQQRATDSAEQQLRLSPEHSAADDSGGVGQCRSPAGSESSGELVDRADAVEDWRQHTDDGGRSTTTPHRAADSDELVDDDNSAVMVPSRPALNASEADYDEWE